MGSERSSSEAPSPVDDVFNQVTEIVRILTTDLSDRMNLMSAEIKSLFEKFRIDISDRVTILESEHSENTHRQNLVTMRLDNLENKINMISDMMMLE